jgi:hypothetical protein
MSGESHEAHAREGEVVPLKEAEEEEEQAIKAIPVLSTRKIVIRRQGQGLGWYFLLRLRR